MLSTYYWILSDQKPKSALSSSCQDDALDEMFRRALTSLHSSEMDEAMKLLGEYCRRRPEDLPGRCALAVACDENGDRSATLLHLRAANELCPGEARILLAIGFSMEKLRDSKGALAYYQDAVQVDKNCITARERIAAIAVRLDNIDLAIEQYEALCHLEPEKSHLRTALGALNYRAGNYATATEIFQQAIAMEPENWSLVDQQVEALVADGEVREAIERLHMLVEEQGPFADLHLRLGDLYESIGDSSSALQQYLTAIDIQPMYLEALVKLGTHHLSNGRWEEACELFHQAAEINDSLIINYVGIGAAQAAMGQVDEALTYFDLAGSLEPNTTLLLTEMARTHLKASAANEAQRSFDGEATSTPQDVAIENEELLRKQLDRHAEQVTLHPGHADVRYRYGVLLRGEGRSQEAMEQFTKAVEINPTYSQALIKLGIIQQELGHDSDAIATFKRVLELSPQYVDVHYRLGLLYTDNRDLQQALRHMEAAAGGAPDNTQIRSALALSLQNMGLHDRTSAVWRSLCRMNPVKM